MKHKVLSLSMITVLAGVACSKKSSSSSTTPATAATTTTTSTTSGKASVASLSSVPSIDGFLKSASTSLSLAAIRDLDRDPEVALGLTTGTPPLFTALANGLSTYLTGDYGQLVTTIQTDRQTSNWTDMVTRVRDYFSAETKCGIMEHTDRMVEALREDTAPLCLLQAVGPVAPAIYTYESGVAISDLTTVFAPTADDKLIQIGNTDKGQPHYEMVKVIGTTNNPNGYHLVYSTCVTTTQKAERQNVVDINNTTGLMTFTSYVNGAIDDQGPKPSTTFTLKGYVTSNSAGSAVPDTSEPRTITFNQAGTTGNFYSSQQGALTIAGNTMTATYFENDSGTDPFGNPQSRVDRTALEVEYTGTQTSDLVIYQGAGHSIVAMTGDNASGTPQTNTSDHSVGFDFDDTQIPRYTNGSGTTSYDTDVAAVDFATDAVLSLSAPTTPDLSGIDDTDCTATPTTHLNYIAKPEDNTVFNAANISCNTLPAQGGGSMCDPLRHDEQMVNEGLSARASAGYGTIVTQ